MELSWQSSGFYTHVHKHSLIHIQAITSVHADICAYIQWACATLTFLQLRIEFRPSGWQGLCLPTITPTLHHHF